MLRHPTTIIHKPTPTTHTAENGKSTFQDMYI